MSEEQSILTSDISYSPASLLHIFNSALAPAQTKKIIQLKGIYQAGKGVPYSGYYYDTLKDEATDALLTLVVPALIRGELKNNKTIEFHGYISKRIVANAGRIEIHAVITQLLQQTVNKYSDKEVRAIEIQQKKAALGYRDADSFIKSRIVGEEAIRVTILIGKTAIIDSDIKHALEEAIGFYDLRFLRINLSSENEILEALKRYNDLQTTDILVLSRGGGENMEVFNSPEIASLCLELEPYFLTAIGHKENTSLVQRVADKAFITPTALGQYLNTIYNETVAELQHSKARLVETITLQLSTNYDKQVQNLQEKIRHLEELNGKSVGLQQQEIQFLKNQMYALQEKETSLYRSAEAYKERVRLMEAKATAATTRFWVVIVIVAIACVLIGRGCGH
jgi:hypothetical protein